MKRHIVRNRNKSKLEKEINEFIKGKVLVDITINYYGALPLYEAVIFYKEASMNGT